MEFVVAWAGISIWVIIMLSTKAINRRLDRIAQALEDHTNG
jgi:hypothetical protein